MRNIYSLFFIICCISVSGQNRLTGDEILNRSIYETGLVHRPLPLDTSRSFEKYGLQKEVLYSRRLFDEEGISKWSHSGLGRITYTTERSIEGNGSLRLKLPTSMNHWPEGAPSDGDYSNYGASVAAYQVNEEDWGKYNRILFYVYPDCEGSRNVHLNLYYRNDGKIKIPDEYNREGTHEINLKNREWNKCFIEISELPRDKIVQIAFGVPAFGKDRTTGDSLQFDIDGIELQQVENPEIVSGWKPAENRIVYSTTGYRYDSPKTAIVNINGRQDGGKFQVIDSKTNQPVFSGPVKKGKYIIGQFQTIDFSALQKPGTYFIKVGDVVTSDFNIGYNIWENSVWRVLNFVFCERCGFPVPGKHGACHGDICARHNGTILDFSGGWHDAGDLSQQTLQTGDVTYALLEMANKARDTNEQLSLRLMEEAEWGLDFILKCRYGDGYRASSAGIVIWTDGLLGNIDDMKARVHQAPFDNFLFAGIEAYAAMSMDKDPMLKEKLSKVAREDFEFALLRYGEVGYKEFPIFWEHSYNTSESQFMATASWAASMIYKMTHDQYYAEKAVEFINYTLDCQRTKPLNDKNQTKGFFYRDKSKNVIVHFNHQSREQIFMQALTLLCKTQPEHLQYDRWSNSIKLYAGYLKNIMQYTAPYGMLPNGIYHIDEADDSASFYSQHLFPGKNARQDFIVQLKNGVKLDEEHYLKRFPVWFSFRGNAATHLAMGKAAAICGNFLNDRELMNIGEEQLYWIVGKNPFGQSFIYGEGDNYAQQYCPLPGEMTGEIPVGIQTWQNEDEPYWPQANNATYKEVWTTSACKWLSLVSEYYNTTPNVR